MRKLASIRKILNIESIPDADAIEVATVDGWNVVVKKNEFKIGDLVVYFEIDSWIPNALAPFLTKNAAIPREYNGISGERLRTIKLRGQVSQGLILPLTILPTGIDDPINEGDDFTEALNVQKWEPTLSAEMNGTAKGTFPTDLMPKTDQERIQNCFKDVAKRDDLYEVTLKLDGSSCTIFKLDNVLRVCSRNMELLINEENAGNIFVKMALLLDEQIPNGLAFQGELMGPGIQGNRENFKEHHFFVFDVIVLKGEQNLRDLFLTDVGSLESGRRISPIQRRSVVDNLGLEHVPIVGLSVSGPTSVVHGLELAEVKSINHPIAEGLVWKSMTNSFSFKTISNRFLLKEK